MERVTPDRVEASFAACGLRPSYGDFYEMNLLPGRPDGCCGLTAVAIAERGATGSDLWNPSKGGMTPAIDSLGMPRNYVEGFIRGWDRPSCDVRPGELYWHLTDEYRAGFDDGKASAIRMGLYTEAG